MCNSLGSTWKSRSDSGEQWKGGAPFLGALEGGAPFCISPVFSKHGRSLSAILVVLSTLGIAVRGTLRICGMSLTIFLVVRLSFYNVCAVCTLGITWVRLPCFSASVCGVGFPDVAMALLLVSACSVSFINCCSSSFPVIAAHFFYRFVTISYGGHNFVSMGDCGFCDFLMAELGGVGEYLTVGCLNAA